MKLIDIILVVILIFGAFRGFQKGLLLELIQFFSFFLAIIIGFQTMYVGAGYISPYIQEEGVALFVAFIVIFFGVILLLNLFGRLLKKLLNLTLLGSIDDIAGALIGLLKWALTISIFIWLLSFFNVSLDPEYTDNAKVYPYVASIAPYMVEKLSFILPYFQELFENGKELIDDGEAQAYRLSISKLGWV